MADGIIVAAMRRGAIAAIDRRIAAHEDRISRLTVEEMDSRGNTFLKRSPEVTSSERSLSTLLSLRQDMLTMDLTSVVKLT